MHGSATRLPSRHQCIPGDVPHAHPPHQFVQPGGVTAGDGVQDQQGLAAQMPPMTLNVPLSPESEASQADLLSADAPLLEKQLV